MLIGITHKCQPQTGFLQMSGNIFRKSFSIIFRTECVKTASVKYKTKRSAFNLVFKKISDYEIAFNVGFKSFFFCLVQSNVRSIRADDLKAILGKPYGIISGSSADIQGFAAWNRMFGHYFDQIEICLADVPGSVPRSVSFSKLLFHCHLNIPYRKIT